MSAADVTSRRATLEAKPPRLVLRFALYTAAAFAIAAGATLWVAQHEAVKRAESQVRFHAEFVADTILADNLAARDFTPQAGSMRIQELDLLFRNEVRTKDVLRVKLYSPDGRVTYSDDHSLIGTRPEGDELPEVMSGETVQDVSTLNHEGGVGPDKKVLEVYTPVRLGSGKPVGVFELYQDYGPVASSVRHELYPIAIILLIALVALFAALFPILRRTTTALLSSIGEQRRSQEALESAEEQLRQSQKMEAIGQLAGGVAHDFNNLLLAIRGYSDLALESLAGANGGVRDDILRIQDATDRAGDLTRRLLAFSRKQVLRPTVFDLNDAVRNLMPILRRLIGEHIAIETSLDASHPYIRADETQFEQVLMNLAVNARDAMPDGGTLTIETRDAVAGSKRYVGVTVRDTGHGMDEQTRSHMFEPFFTTKEEGKGTGLGLATVYGIVSQSGGFVTVESEPGRGAEFNVHLPAVEQPAEPRPLLPVDAPGGTETILVAEDDHSVRAMLVRVLDRHGYRVLQARDADDALRISRGEAIELLVTDVVLPGMSGPKLAAAMRAGRPDLRVLYVSGHAWETFEQEGVGTEEPFLRKPFSSRDLALKVRATLDATEALRGRARARAAGHRG
jgi:two-component system cell cycle sensor histidine kinase/response regulator CckA